MRVSFLALAVLVVSTGRAAEPLFAPVESVFKAKCLACHSGKASQAGLDLSSADGALRGGKSGPAIAPGSPGQSLLLEKVIAKTMPPGKDKLTEAEIASIRSWIEGSKSSAASVPVTDSDVAPVFQMRCVVCHGKRKQEGGLDLRTRASLLKGGQSGPAIIPGKPEESLLLKRVLAGQMPPPKLLFEYFVRPPNSGEVETLKKWIAAGAPAAPKQEVVDLGASDPLVSAKDREFWSFRPPVQPPVPTVAHKDLVRNEIDAFLLAKLEAKGLSYSTPLEPHKLVRRVYLDLTGLPPTRVEVEAYLQDQRPDAYERLVDRLLASPHYGERWAQFWLNAAGYSDSEGIIDEDRLRPNAWRYRDFVIRSLNSDKPYDQFLMEQIAGGELVDRSQPDPGPEVLEKLTATGFLRMALDGTYSPANGSVAERMNVIADEIEILSSSVMGLTVGCARCHNHKYDPIPQRDYYRFAAILQTAYDPYDWVKPTERNLDVASASERQEVTAHNTPYETRIKSLEEALQEKAKPLRQKLLGRRLTALPEGVRADLERVNATPEAQRTELQKYLAEKFADTLKMTDDELAQEFPEFKTERQKVLKDVADQRKHLRAKPDIRALYEMGGDPSPVYLLRRGEAQSIGERVDPGTPSVLRAGLTPFTIKAPRPDSSGRRLALARWLTQPQHPLTSRVMVNRLWMHYFGRGIVPTPANFGRTGLPPSHPELLDWLATKFVQQGWSIKAMQRLIVTSAAYRQSSGTAQQGEAADPENVLLWRMPMRRMDAEQLHDSILKAAGSLDETAFGPPVTVETKASGEVVAKGAKPGWRRSIYVLQRRTTPLNMLEVFDLPPMSPNCIERKTSTVSTQALQMMNSDTIRERARYLAGRLMDAFPGKAEAQIEDLYLRTYARKPSPAETAAALQDLQGLTKQWSEQLNREGFEGPRTSAAPWRALASLCHAVLSSAEFTYID